MENWTQVQTYAELSADSLGQAAKKMEAYNDSLEAAKNRLQAALESFATNGVITTIEKWLVNLGTFFAENGVLVVGLIAAYTVMKALTSNTGAASFALTNFTKALNSSTSLLSGKKRKEAAEKAKAAKNKDGSSTNSDNSENDSPKQKLKDLGKGIAIKAGTAVGAVGFAEAANLASEVTTGEEASGTVQLISGVIGSQVGSFLSENASDIASSGLKGLQSVTQGAGMLGKVKGLVTGLGSGAAEAAGIEVGSKAAAVLGGGVIAAVAIALVGVGKKIYDYIEAKELAAAQEAYQAAVNEYTSKKTAGANAERYAELAKGVNSLGENLSLTDDEYSEFLQISNTLADAFPELVSSTDELGNKFVLLDKTTTEIIDGINDEIDSAQAVANSTLTDSSLLKNNAKNAKADIKSIKKQKTSASLIYEKIQNGTYLFSNDEIDYVESLGINIGIMTGAEIEKSKDKILNVLQQNIEELNNNMATLGAEYLETYFALLNESAANIIKPEDYTTAQNSMMSKILANQNIVDSTDQTDANFKTELAIIAQAMEPLLSSTAFQEAYSASANSYATLGQYNKVIQSGISTLSTAYDSWVASDSIGQAKADEMLESLGYKIDDDTGAIVKSANLYDTLMDLADKSDTENIAGVKQAISNMTFTEGGAAKEILATAWGQSLTGAELLQATHRDAAASNTYEDLEAYISETHNQRSQLTKDIQNNRLNYRTMVRMGDNGQYEAIDEATIDERYAQYSSKIREGIKNAAKAYAEGMNNGEDLVELTAELNVKLDTIALNKEIDATGDKVKKTLTEAFSNIDLGTDGLINNFTELKTVVDSMVSSFDKLKDAYDEQTTRGKLSVQTVLDLVTTDEQYLDVLEVKNGKIQLVSNAQAIMAQKQVDAAKAGIEQLIVEKQQRVALLEQSLGSDQYIEALNDKITQTDADSESLARNTEITKGNTYALLSNAYAQQGDLTNAQKYGKLATQALETATSETRLTTDNSSDVDNTLTKDQREAYEKEYKTLTGMSYSDVISKYGSFANVSLDTLKSGSIATLYNMTEILSTEDAISTITSDVKSTLDGITDKLDKLKAIASTINKEFAQMQSFINGNRGDITANYYDLQKENLKAQVEENKKILKQYTTSSKEYYETLADIEELKVQINNLDDEAVQDVIDILEAQKGRQFTEEERLEYQEKYIQANKDYLATLDTELEYWENLKKVGEAYVTVLNTNVEKLNNKLSNLEFSKPEEWTGWTFNEDGTIDKTHDAIEEIITYYDEAKSINQEIYDLAETLLSSEEFLAYATEDQINEVKKTAQDALKAVRQAEEDSLQAQITYQEKAYSAVTSVVNEYIDGLNKQKELVEEVYDEELKKLNDKNTAIERTNKLIELQKNLLTAQQEKERTYVAGIGWVYQANRTKVKEAQTALKDFYRQDQVDDLTNAKEAEVKVLEDRIKNWQNYLEALEEQYKAQETLQNKLLAMEALGVDSEEQLQERLLSDMTSFNQNLAAAKITSAATLKEYYQTYNTALSNYLTEYSNNVEKLRKLKNEELAIENQGATGTTGSSSTPTATAKDEGNVGETLTGASTTTTTKTTTKATATKGGNYSSLSTKLIQQILQDLGFDIGSSGIDGSYGPATTKAVMKFQEAHGLTVDGNVGPQTQKALETALEDMLVYGYAEGIQNGPVTYTGLAMLHGTPSSPEFVLNSDQAYNILRYLATTKPEYTSNLDSAGDTIYQFQGGITMNGVNDPEQFFSELMKATSNRFSVTKNRK